MLKYGNRDFRNLQEQVYANMQNIEDIIRGQTVLADFKITIVGAVDTAAELPDPETYEGEVGDIYVVGTESPYNLYVFAKVYENENIPQWVDLGPILVEGPQGPQGEQGIQGPAGADGQDGEDGADGITPHIGANGDWFIGETDTEVHAQGPQGEPGETITAIFDEDRVSGAPELGSITVEGTAWNIPQGEVQDVKVNGTSVVSQGVASITVPTKTSDLTNDSGFITKSVDDLTNYTKTSDLASVATSGSYADLSNTPDLSIYAESADLATVATTGSYTDLSNTPTIPDATSDLTNDSGFITASDIPVTDVEVDGVSVVSSGVAEITMPTIPVTDVEVNGVSVLSGTVAEITVPAAPVFDNQTIIEDSGVRKTAIGGYTGTYDEEHVTLALPWVSGQYPEYVVNVNEGTISQDDFEAEATAINECLTPKIGDYVTVKIYLSEDGNTWDEYTGTGYVANANRVRYVTCEALSITNGECRVYLNPNQIWFNPDLSGSPVGNYTYAKFGLFKTLEYISPINSNFIGSDIARVSQIPETVTADNATIINTNGVLSTAVGGYLVPVNYHAETPSLPWQTIDYTEYQIAVSTGDISAEDFDALWNEWNSALLTGWSHGDTIDLILFLSEDNITWAEYQATGTINMATAAANPRIDNIECQDLSLSGMSFRIQAGAQSAWFNPGAQIGNYSYAKLLVDKTIQDISPINSSFIGSDIARTSQLQNLNWKGWKGHCIGSENGTNFIFTLNFCSNTQLGGTTSPVQFINILMDSGIKDTVGNAEIYRMLPVTGMYGTDQIAGVCAGSGTSLPWYIITFNGLTGFTVNTITDYNSITSCFLYPIDQ